jgi:hypothetical protein
MLNVIVLVVIMLNAIMLNSIMLSVIKLCVVAPIHRLSNRSQFLESHADWIKKKYDLKFVKKATRNEEKC